MEVGGGEGVGWRWVGGGGRGGWVGFEKGVWAGRGRTLVTSRHQSALRICSTV